MYTLAACAEMLFLDQPIQERARRVHDLGFQVEIWDWTRHDLAALERSGAVFASMTAPPSCSAPPGSRSVPPCGWAARG
jgi:hydroxypyruvate isomerase